MSMKLILQLSLMQIVLFKSATSSSAMSAFPTCVNFTSIDLKIPRGNLIVVGAGRKANDSWHQHIYWLDTPAGDLNVFISTEVYPYIGQSVPERQGNKGQKLWLFSKERDNAFLEFIRIALGLTPPVKIPGKVRVPSTHFTNGKCWPFPALINIFPNDDRDHYKYHVSLDVIDDDKNKILTGHLEYVYSGKIWD